MKVIELSVNDDLLVVIKKCNTNIKQLATMIDQLTKRVEQLEQNMEEGSN